ncbi:MAG: IS91 family transposase [Gammaproteobacteria bacterium]|nr:IS91 family transposase [Gammaproteobacteria bacterium]NIQ91915.1 IS91 family transposase [Deltaproteobacteria bacterium]NIX02091.1 IS91 family transposase [Phycisphaerae bacterium]
MPSIATQTAGNLESTRPCYEVADIFREYGEQYKRSHSLPLSHLKVMHAIEVCHTAYLGGHVERCDRCGYERIAYNSCRNRHCPKCQALAKAEWLEKRKAELLPVGYFHNVFTIPHELNQVVLCNKKVVFDLLFKTVAETLQEFASDPKHGLGGKIGFTAILHTWDQKLLGHIHLHCVIPAGVLSFDSRFWFHSRKNFLFPVKALSKVFRGKLIYHLKKAFAKGKLIFPGQIASLATEENFLQLINQLWKKDWVVYSKAPFNGPVLDYLGRYTHRVAIANHRIVKVEDGLVTFRYRDRADGDDCKHMTITAQEFIRRFLLHVLPESFQRLRHFGLLANRCKSKDLARCREIFGLSADPPEVPEETAQEKILRLTGVDVSECPRCRQGRMRRVLELQMPSVCVPRDSPLMPEVLDTS